MVNPDGKLPVRVGDLVAGKYRLDRVLGVGGMGVVAAATHIELEQAVALKFVLPQMLDYERFRERFLREARASVRLKSEHVARVYDVGATEDGVPFLVMELLEGRDLASLIQERGRLPVGETVEYVLQACEAIWEAHQNGIVHRDLKPANLFLTRRSNGAPLVKVLDFGISKVTGPAAMDQAALTVSSAVLGSPLYMAPEQLRSARNAAPASDIWSMGVIVYELLTGKVPFLGETMTELCLRVVNDPAVPPNALRGELPDALVVIVMRCLEKEPRLRFPNIAALGAALEPFSLSGGRAPRAWHSIADTGSATAFPESLTAPAPAPTQTQRLAGSENATWGGTHRTEPSRRRSRVRAGGFLAAGALLAVGAALFAARGLRAPRGDGAFSAAASAPAVESHASSGSFAPSPPASIAPPSAPPPASSAAEASGAPDAGAAKRDHPAHTPPHHPALVPSAETPRTSVNGAPILH